ncbi:choice-of-anchor G family protein [Humidisolicoccus flavus]|uniref:choice-of-anchor G family protein n=1 Tax=Humidisolicoccus flavus TaxID=3111414 RepID=UPI00324B1DFD
MENQQRQRRRVVGMSAVALGVAGAMLAPLAATAAPVVSQGNGRLLDISVLQSDLTDLLAVLNGAEAINVDASQESVVSNTPLDAEAVAFLIGLQAGTLNLFGDNGVVQLGAVGQYAQANDDGSSLAFSGAVSAADGLIGVDTVTPSPSVGTPFNDGSASVSLSTAQILGGTNLVEIDLSTGVLASSASLASDGTQAGDYVVADVAVTVGGSLLTSTLNLVRPTIDTLLAVVNPLIATDVVNPISADGTISISEAELALALGVTSLNDAPVNTNLLAVLPTLIVNQLTNTVTGLLDQVQAIASGLGVTGLVVNTALTTARLVLDPLLASLAADLGTPLGAAIDALAAVRINKVTTTADESFVQTAMAIEVGAGGSIATVDLASAAVGPNAGEAAIPIAGLEALLIGLPLVGLVAAAVWFVNRRRLPALRIAG